MPVKQIGKGLGGMDPSRDHDRRLRDLRGAEGQPARANHADRAKTRVVSGYLAAEVLGGAFTFSIPLLVIIQEMGSRGKLNAERQEE